MNVLARAALVLLLIFLLPLPLVSADDAAKHLDAAIRARAAAEYQSAITELQKAVALAPDELRYRLLLAETEGWARQFAAAEATYRDAAQRAPRNLEARFGLGTTLLWQEKYAAAVEAFRAVLRDAPENAAARESLANALYWSGDIGAARDEYRALLTQKPEHVAARKAVAEIDASLRPNASAHVTLRDDDQPFTMRRGALSGHGFSDPLTRWSAAAGVYRLEAPDLGAAESAPFAELGVRRTIPRVRLTLAARIRALAFADDGAIYPAVSLSREAAIGSVSLSYAESELLYSERSIAQHPSVRTTSLRWWRERSASWSASASASSHAYSDGNHGVAADAWLLAPLFQDDRYSMLAGPALSYRHTDESRFRPDTARGGGIYDPYWTPQRLVDVRAVLSAAMRAGPGRLSLHADFGRARDEVPDLFGGTFEREFSPWRVKLTFEFPLTPYFSVSSGVERESTVFYNSNELFANVSRRF